MDAQLIPNEREWGYEAQAQDKAQDLGHEDVESGEHEHAAEDRGADVPGGEDRERAPAIDVRRASDVRVDSHFRNVAPGKNCLVTWASVFHCA